MADHDLNTLVDLYARFDVSPAPSRRPSLTVGRPPSSDLLDALRLIRDGYPVHAASVATGVATTNLYRLLARYRDASPIPSVRATAALQRYGL